jgi:hypothetical protein
MSDPFSRVLLDSHEAVLIPSSVAMPPDGRYLGMIFHDDQRSAGSIHFWDLERWIIVGWIEWNPEDDLRALAFSPGGPLLATESALEA